MLALKMSTCPPECPSASGGWLFQQEEGHSTDIYRVPATRLGTVVDSGESSKYLTSGDFPGDPMVKNPPSNAGDMGSIPSQGTKIPHAAG